MLSGVIIKEGADEKNVCTNFRKYNPIMKHTKIVATVSDKRCDVDFIKALSEAGVNVVRMNSAHLDKDGMKKIVDNVREADRRLAIMIDTKGPEIRTTITVDGNPVEFSTGDEVVFLGDVDGLTSRKEICLNYSDISKHLHEGDRLLIDDGELAFRVKRIDGDRVYAVSENDGSLGSRKSVNVPGVPMPLPAVTERDRTMLEHAAYLGVDFVAHSFVRSREDVAAVQKILDDLGVNMKIISKIENQEGVDNFDDILDASYGIMIARGDLGIEVAAETIPGIQLNMVNKCIRAHKPVIVATQMLHSMIEHPRPTRAEVSDVANAVYQRADAMMLSGETASGKYPLEAVRTMSKVALEVERSISGHQDVPPLSGSEVASFLARQAVLSEGKVGTQAIIADTHHGATARFIASYRGNMPIFAICYNRSVARWLALSYGVVPCLDLMERDASRHHPVEAIKSLITDGRLSGDTLVAYLGATRNTSSLLEIDTVENLATE